MLCYVILSSQVRAGGWRAALLAGSREMGGCPVAGSGEPEYAQSRY